MAEPKPKITRTRPREQDLDLTRGLYRKLYAGLITDRRINAVSIASEVLYFRLHFLADDFGNCDGDPRLIVCLAFPLRRDVTEAQIATGLAELVQVGLVSIYQSNGQSYAHIVGFEEAQPAGKNGRKIRKFPAPVGIPGDPRKSGNAQTHHHHDHDHDQTQDQAESQNENEDDHHHGQSDDDSPSDSANADVETQCDLDLKTKGTPAYRLAHKWKFPHQLIQDLYFALGHGPTGEGPDIAAAVLEYLNTHPDIRNPVGYVGRILVNIDSSRQGLLAADTGSHDTADSIGDIDPVKQVYAEWRQMGFNL